MKFEEISAHQKHWPNMQREHLRKKPLLLYATKVLSFQPRENREGEVVGHVIGHAMFVATLLLGVIIDLGSTFRA